MKARKYQRRAAEFNQHTELDAIACGLAAEAGEVCAEFQKSDYKWQPLDTDAVEKELGDVLWYVAVICDICGLNLSEVMRKNLRKLEERHNA